MRILASEAAVRNLIREGKIHQLASVMQTGQRQGMQTLDMALQDLVARGVITKDEAQLKATNPQLFGAPTVGATLASSIGARS